MPSNLHHVTRVLESEAPGLCWRTLQRSAATRDYARSILHVLDFFPLFTVSWFFFFVGEGKFLHPLKSVFRGKLEKAIFQWGKEACALSQDVSRLTCAGRNLCAVGWKLRKEGKRLLFQASSRCHPVSKKRHEVPAQHRPRPTHEPRRRGRANSARVLRGSAPLALSARSTVPTPAVPGGRGTGPG